MSQPLRHILTACVILLIMPLWASARMPDAEGGDLPDTEMPDTIPIHLDRTPLLADTLGSDTLAIADVAGFDDFDETEGRMRMFNPDPNRAVWLSALFPGLGQIYNRRYWKLPIVVGGFMGLGYATSWNNTMLTDYTRAYRDLMDNDPATKSYMNFFPTGVSEDSLDKTWLENILKSRKNYFRRNRDLCIISMVAVYLLAMVDAYVDAALSHFDITPDLTMNWTPTLIQDTRGVRPSVGIQCGFRF